jgi:YlmC/YmxH family sporulation protein
MSAMRLSELVGREIVDMKNGEKIGQLGRADLCINIDTGKIEQVIFPVNRSLLSFGKQRQEYTLTWNSIRKIGQDLILVHLQGDPKTD